MQNLSCVFQKVELRMGGWRVPHGKSNAFLLLQFLCTLLGWLESIFCIDGPSFPSERRWKESMNQRGHPFTCDYFICHNLWLPPSGHCSVLLQTSIFISKAGGWKILWLAKSSLSLCAKADVQSNITSSLCGLLKHSTSWTTGPFLSCTSTGLGL